MALGRVSNLPPGHPLREPPPEGFFEANGPYLVLGAAPVNPLRSPQQAEPYPFYPIHDVRRLSRQWREAQLSEAGAEEEARRRRDAEEEARRRYSTDGRIATLEAELAELKRKQG